MTQDGISFCANSVDLIAESTAMTKFMSRSSTVPEIQPKSGIFSFDLTWAEIQTLKRKDFLRAIVHIHILKNSTINLKVINFLFQLKWSTLKATTFKETRQIRIMVNLLPLLNFWNWPRQRQLAAFWYTYR
jgi:hypothetical protein